MIRDLPRRPCSQLPVAPQAVDAALVRQLVESAPTLHAWAVTLVPRCAYAQIALKRGTWLSKRELSSLQRQSRSVLRAAHAHRGLSVETLAALDRLHGFVTAQDITSTARVSA